MNTDSESHWCHVSRVITASVGLFARLLLHVRTSDS